MRLKTDVKAGADVLHFEDVRILYPAILNKKIRRKTLAIHLIMNISLAKFATIAASAAILMYSYYKIDLILKTRNKNGFWLVIFFGPIFSMAYIGEKYIDLTNNGFAILYICAAAFLGLPTAIWGFLEISAGMKNK